MNKAKFTSGPWVVDNDDCVYGGPAGMDHVAQCFDGDSKANARLIAAAPELLETSSRVVEQFEQFILTSTGYVSAGDWPTLTALKAAIAKAKEDIHE
jgi:hypothetical protein